MSKKFEPALKILLIIALVAAATFAFIKFAMPAFEKKPAPASTATGPRPVKVTRVLSQYLERIDQIPGEIYAYQDVAIYPKVPGFIEWIGVDRGSIVKKGDLLIGLIAPEMEARKNKAAADVLAMRSRVHEAEAMVADLKSKVLEAKAKLAGDSDTFQRTKQASLTPGVVAPNTVIVLENLVEADKERVVSMEAQVLAAQNRLAATIESERAAMRMYDNYKDLDDYLKIAAPFDGYITERNMHVGSFSGPRGESAYPPIIRIQQLNNLRVVAPVPEVDTAGVLPGKEVEFTVSTHPDRRFVGKVERIGNYLVQRTRTMPVELNFWNHDYEVLPGMFCEIFWPTRRKYPTLFVPTSAIVTESTLKTFVLKVNNSNKIEWITVRKGQIMGNMQEIFGKIDEGDSIVVKGSDELKPGTQVKAELVSNHEAQKAPEKRPRYPASHGS